MTDDTPITSAMISEHGSASYREGLAAGRAETLAVLRRGDPEDGTLPETAEYWADWLDRGFTNTTATATSGKLNHPTRSRKLVALEIAYRLLYPRRDTDVAVHDAIQKIEALVPEARSW